VRELDELACFGENLSKGAHKALWYCRASNKERGSGCRYPATGTREGARWREREREREKFMDNQIDD